MKKKILVLGGGISKERLISLETAKSVLKELKKNNYNAVICEPDKNLINKIKKFKPDIVFNALHGQFGEDGYIQTILENFKIPYTHSGIISSAIAMNKEIKATNITILIVQKRATINKPKTVIPAQK